MTPISFTRGCAAGALGIALLAPTFLVGSASAAPDSAAISARSDASPTAASGADVARARKSIAEAKEVSSATAVRAGLTVTTTEYLPGSPATVSGTGVAGRQVVVVFPGEPFNFGITDVDDDGRWTLTSQRPVTQPDEVTATVTMGTGPSAIEIDHTFTAAERSLVVDGGTYVRGERATVRGTTDPHQHVSVVFPGTAFNYGTARADEHGRWSTTSQLPVDEGAAITVAVSTGPEGFTKEVEHTLQADERTLTVDDGTYLPGEKVTITGTANPNLRVVADFSTPETPRDIVGVDVDSEGRWTATSKGSPDVTGQLMIAVTSGSGPNELRVEKTLTARERTLTVDEGTYVPGERARLRGTADPGAAIFAEFPSTAAQPIHQGVGHANEDGRWELSSAYAIESDAPLLVRVTSGVGTSTEKQIERTLTSTERVLTAEPGRYLPGERATISGTGNAGSVVLARFTTPDQPYNDGTARVDDDGNWTVTSPAAVQWSEDLTVTISSGTGDHKKEIEQTLTARERTLTAEPGTYVPGSVTTITGTADPDVFVSADFGTPGSGFDSTRADSDGRWAITSRLPVDTTEPLLVRVTSGIGDHAKTIEVGLTAQERVLTANPGTFLPGEPATITGTTNPGATVYAHFDTSTTNAGSTKADDEGNWSVTSRLPVQSSDSVTVSVSTGSAAYDRTIEQTLSAVERTLTLTTTTFVPNELVTISGTADPGVSIGARFPTAADPNNVGATKADGNGAWTITSARPVTEGDQLDVKVTSGSGEFAREIERTLTAAQTPVSPLEVTSGTEYTKGEKITVAGKNTPNKTVELLDTKGALLRQIPTGNDGTWSFTTGGAYTADTVTWNFASGGQTVQHTLTGTARELALEVTSGTEYTKGEKITVTGKNTPNKTVELRDTKGALLRTITTNTTGDWTFTTGGTYTADTVTWTLTSGTQTVQHTLTAMAESPLRVTSPTDYVKGQKITVTGKNTPNKTVELRDTKGALLRTITTNTTGDWTFTTGGAYTADTVTWTLTSGTHQMTHTITGK
ncbi:Ig-like domain-containing protein [Curtobacterium sp. USHLN213]|uniref:Ig-like domain-containing protein n=1 Tax=Curtobacterium sp. USHLN213 TaxID=3081255 RepID=UPI0030170AE1